MLNDAVILILFFIPGYVSKSAMFLILGWAEISDSKRRSMTLDWSGLTGVAGAVIAGIPVLLPWLWIPPGNTASDFAYSLSTADSLAIALLDWKVLVTYWLVLLWAIVAGGLFGFLWAYNSRTFSQILGRSNRMSRWYLKVRGWARRGGFARKELDASERGNQQRRN